MGKFYTFESLVKLCFSFVGTLRKSVCAKKLVVGRPCAKTLTLFGPDDSRSALLKEKMFALINNRQDMREQISQVRKNLESEYAVSFSDVTGVTPSVAIDPLHAEPPAAPPILVPNLDPIPISVAPRGKAVGTISGEPPIPISATIPDPVTQVTSHVCLYPSKYILYS